MKFLALVLSFVSMSAYANSNQLLCVLSAKDAGREIKTVNFSNNQIQLFNLAVGFFEASIVADSKGLNILSLQEKTSGIVTQTDFFEGSRTGTLSLKNPQGFASLDCFFQDVQN